MDNTLMYNKAVAVGRIEELGEPNPAGKHKIVTCLLNCENIDGSLPYKPKMLQLRAWDDIARSVERYKVGDRVQVVFSISSKENKKAPGSWYHVITIKEILAL